MSHDPPAETTPAPLLIPEPYLRAMVDHCKAGAPHEACGLLSGVAPLVSAFHPLNNIKASETRYLADPADLIRAVEAIRLAKTEILAIYHSHPRSPAIPSQVDLRENYYDDVPRIIVSLMGETPDVRTWRLWPDRYAELPWAVAPVESERSGD